MKFLSALGYGIITCSMILSCNSGEQTFDATGVFEADEILVAAEIPGRIRQMNIEEGDLIPKDSLVAIIDAGNLALQQVQVEESMAALQQKTADAAPQLKMLSDQLAVEQSQLDNALKEQSRMRELVKADAATTKQLDDMDAKVDVLRRQMVVTRQQMKVYQENIATQNRSVLSERNPLAAKAKVIADQVARAQVVNPVTGTVLTRYANQGEIIAAGKAIYKIADLRQLILRAYVTGTQLSAVKLGNEVTVLTDSNETAYKSYKGRITWIADKAEFTPKTIQTREERANLVYAIKIAVPNDGYLKIGMYAEVKF